MARWRSKRRRRRNWTRRALGKRRLMRLKICRVSLNLLRISKVLVRRLTYKREIKKADINAKILLLTCELKLIILLFSRIFRNRVRSYKYCFSKLIIFSIRWVRIEQPLLLPYLYPTRQFLPVLFSKSTKRSGLLFCLARTQRRIRLMGKSRRSRNV